MDAKEERQLRLAALVEANKFNDSTWASAPIPSSSRGVEHVLLAADAFYNWIINGGKEKK